ncbi:hypothetical protein HYT45_00810 [Candidatus Uhrbacteria bacterium]|nr:hypothetical protein [Candidatus Uhrbacteria bacterium]
MNNNFTPIQKASLALLLFLGLSGLVLAFPFFNRRIKQPFVKDKSKKYLTLEEREKQKLAELKTQDTDNDGLDDYDELYIYRTSPYLDDTDSDGIKDLEEAQNGGDPNCPKGRDCGGLTSSDSAPPGTNTTVAPPPADALGALEHLQNLSAADIRKLLSDSGVPQDVLKSVDDETLRGIYDDALKTMSASGTAAKAQAQQ